MKPSMNKPFYTSNYFFISLLLLIPFSIFAFGVTQQTDWLNAFDQFIASPILTARSPEKTAFYSFITDMGGTFFIILMTLLVSLYFILKKKDFRTAYWYIFHVAIGAGVLNQVVKLIFQRTRPTIEHLVSQDGYSFPSGHSMASLICYGGIVLLIFHLDQKNWIKLLACLFAVILILTVGISRIYLGVHFPSDVFAGFCLAGSWVSLSAAIYSKKIQKNS